MTSNQPETARATFHNLVVAIFKDGASASDAIADLSRVGFSPREIGIALSEENKQANKKVGTKDHIQAISDKEHSFMWRLRRRFERDLHSLSVDLSTGEETAASDTAAPPYTEINLGEVLSELGVSQDRIQLVDSEIGVNGSLMMVDAGSRWKEVQSILERNCGMIRTDMATERSLQPR